MAVAYTKSAWGEIEQPLMDLLSREFPNVYISPIMQNAGNESVRINLTSSSNLQTTKAFEQRSYDVTIRYYLHDVNLRDMQQNESVKNKVDRLKGELMNRITAQPVTAGNQLKLVNGQWDELIVDSIEYNVQDDENDEEENLYIAELNLTIQATINH